MLVLLGLRLTLLGAWPLMDTTEARYADIARRMIAADDWVTPWFDQGVPFWGKPPLSFWMTVASLRTFGFSEFAARLPHFLCMLAVVGLAASAAADRRAGLGRIVCALMLGSLIVFTATGAVMTDAPLVLGITLAAVAFQRAVERPLDAGGPPWGLLFFVGLAVGVLAKGPLALVLTGAAVAGWWIGAGVRAGARVLRTHLPWGLGGILFAVLVVPWFALAELRTPGFLQYFLVGEHILRFTQPGWEGDRYGNAHQEPIGMIWAFAAAGFWPWSLLLPVAAAMVWRGRRLRDGGLGHPPEQALRERRWRGWLAGWALGPLLLFTPARNTIWMYALPAAVPLALWVGDWMVRRLSPRACVGWLSAGLLISMATVGVYLVDAGAQIERKSTQALIAALPPDAVRAPGQGGAPTPGRPRDRILFLGLRPFSASWYSDGQAEKVDGHAALAAMAPELVRTLGSGGRVWVAVPPSLSAQPPSVPGLVARREQAHGGTTWWQLMLPHAREGG